MIKRILCLLCTCVLTLSCAWTILPAVYAEETTEQVNLDSCMPEFDESASVVVGYLPTSSDSNIVATARFAALAIQSRCSSQFFYAAKLTPTKNDNKRQANPEHFNSLISASDAKGAIDKKGFNEDEAAAMAATTTKTQVWMIMDVAAVQELKEDSTLIQQLSAMQENENIFLTMLFIGDTAFSMNGGTAVAEMLKQAPERSTWVQLQSDFLQQKVNRQDTLHTGNWFTAALYGTPVDLPIAEVEGEQFFTFDMPVDGSAVIVTQQDETMEKPEVSGENGKCSGETHAFQYSASNRGKTGIVVTLLTGLTANQRYTVSYGQDAKVLSNRVYLMADFAKLAPTLNLPYKLTRSEQTATLSVGEHAFGQGERFQVQWNWNGTNVSGSAFDEVSGRWMLAQTPAENDTSVQVNVSLKLYAEDGDLLYSWKSESLERPVVNSELTATRNTKTLTLYYFAGDGRNDTVSFAIGDYLSYNRNDEVSLNVNGHDLTEGEISVADGFTLTYDQTNGSMTLTVDDDWQGEDETIPLTLEARNEEQSVQTTVTVQTYCVNSLVQKAKAEILDEAGHDVSAAEDNQAYEVKAGQAYTWRVALSENAATIWNNMPQTEDTVGIPHLEDVSFVVTTMDAEEVTDVLATSTDLLSLTGGGESAMQLEPLATGKQGECLSAFTLEKNDDGAYQGEAVIRFANAWANDESVDLHLYAVYEDHTAGSKRILTEQTVQCHISNANVRVTGKVPTTPSEIRLTGMPDHLESKEVNLQEVLDIKSLAELFTDDETPDALTYSLRVSSTEGVTVQQDQQELESITSSEEETASALYAEIDPQQPVTVDFSAKGDVQITLYASDRVNEPPAEVSISFHVVSEIEILALYAACGAAALIVLAILVLVIVQAKKPAFGGSPIRCVACADTMDGSDINKLLMQSHAAELYPFRKNRILLSQLLVMTRQAPLPSATALVTEDIEIAPGGKKGIVLHYGKKAKKQLACKGKEAIPYGGLKEIRHGHTIITILNDR
ncbi:MAG: hypothetical protein Q4B32_09050 [Clostridia bacterium]|nr:hypothetical protein [Clostridia bacterium]